MSLAASPSNDGARAIRLLLCGDVMIGRGVDQILPSPCPPKLYEEYVSSAQEYVRLAEAASGPIPRPVDLSYVWGEALAEIRAKAPDASIVNLETSVTRSETAEAKAINYRVSPQNAECLRAFGVDCCALANNHVLDWGPSGLADTLDSLARLGVAFAGAGRTIDDARRPAILDIPGKGRVVILSFALPDSGTPFDWAATRASPGVNLLPDLSSESVDLACDWARNAARPSDILVVSIHWGANWGYCVSNAQRQFAHRLIEDGGAAIIHGHSSHHPKGIEVYLNRLILYGCGDFLNDYEGIGGFETYRGDLALMYFVDVDAASGELRQLRLFPLHMRRLRLERAENADVVWLADRLDRESAPFGVRVLRQDDGALATRWDGRGTLRRQ